MKSKLQCPKCGRGFEYKWIPTVSFVAIKWGKKRYMRCPKCHKFSWFNIWDTRVSKKNLRNTIKTVRVHSSSYIELYYRIPLVRIMSGLTPPIGRIQNLKLGENQRRAKRIIFRLNRIEPSP